MNWILLAVLALAAAGGALTVTRLLKIPDPPTVIRLACGRPSRSGAHLPAREVPASPRPAPLPHQPRPLPEQVRWKGGHISVERFLDLTNSRAFLVLRNGAVAHEWYRDGVDARTQLSSWSVAKSIVSLMAGQAIADGKLREEDLLTTLLPELRTDTEYDQITVAHLLDMTSGIDVPEEYRRHLPLTGTARMYLTRDLPGFVRRHRILEFTPGSKGAYRSVNTQLLGQILAAVEAEPLARLLYRRLWEPIGAQDPARWNLDRPGGAEKAFCGINATVRDFAKIGELVLNDGRVGSRQLVPAAWIRRIANPASLPVDGWGYSAQWWHPLNAERADYAAIGIYGQYIYINPADRTVIVKFSDHGTQQDELDTIQVFRAIASGMSAARPREAAGARSDFPK